MNTARTVCTIAGTLVAVAALFSACTNRPATGPDGAPTPSGPSGPSGPGGPTNPPATGGPTAPGADFTVSPQSARSAVIGWKAVPGAVWYVLRRDGQQLAKVWDTQTRFRDPNLEPGTHAYALEAQNADGQVLARYAASATTPDGPKAPSSADLSSNTAEQGRAYAKYGWTPNPKYDTCPKWLHDTYWAYGPDNRVYPTWHPPTDTDPATGKACTYGHEHGRDPAGSNLRSTLGPIPFGYVNEQLSATDPNGQRNEDHVGHKIEYKNAVKVGVPGDATGNDFQSGSGPVCDVLTKLHQGTHSPDAFTNNMHELLYAVSCDNGVGVRWLSFHHFGPAGVVQKICGQAQNLGGFSPPSSPTLENGSTRNVPDNVCLERLRAKVQQGGDASAEYYANYGEDWTSGVTHALHRDNKGAYHDNWGQAGAERNPPLQFEFSAGTYFSVRGPSRYFDPAKPANLGRRVDMCFDDSLQITHPDCVRARQTKATWDSPDSPFKGSERTTHFDWVTLKNPNGQRVYYSNPMGTLTRPQPDAATGVTLRQWVSSGAGEAMYYFGQRSGDFDAPGVHAPN